MVRVLVTRMKTCQSVEIVEVATPALSADLSEYGRRLLLAFLSCDVLPTVLRDAHLTEVTFLATRYAVVG